MEKEREASEALQRDGGRVWEQQTQPERGEVGREKDRDGGIQNELQAGEGAGRETEKEGLGEERDVEDSTGIEERSGEGRQ